MEHLSEEQIEALRGQLDGEASTLRGRIAQGRSTVADNPSPEPGDVEDAAAQDAARFQARQLLERDRARLREVEAAVERMKAGSYGICEESGEPISFRRLQLEPTTRYTVEALEELEGKSGVADPHADEPIGY